MCRIGHCLNNRSRYTGKIMTQVCVMGFQHDLVNYILVCIHLKQHVRARNWDKFININCVTGISTKNRIYYIII